MQRTARIGTDIEESRLEEEITCTHCGFTLDSERVWSDDDNRLYTFSFGRFREYNGFVLRPVSSLG